MLIIFERTSSKEGKDARNLTWSTSIILHSKDPPIILSFLLVLEKSTAILAAFIGSPEYAIAVGPLNNSETYSKEVPGKDNFASLFFATLNLTSDSLIFERSSSNSLTFKPE